MAIKILPAVTTITPGQWRNKVKEIDELGLKEIALFPTCLEIKERQELYNLLEKTGLEKIPHVHLREQDFAEWEIDYLTDKYQTEAFNIHRHESGGKVLSYKKYLGRIYIENVYKIDQLFWEFVDKTAGICLDISHWEDFGKRLKFPGYDVFARKISRYKIGCNHISAVKDQPHLAYDKFEDVKLEIYSDHTFQDLSEFDYIKDYKKYLSNIVSIELENTLAEQLKVKAYLEKIING